MIVRAMTWNIHAGIGPDGKYDLDRVLGLIRRHRPDVLAVQEVESRNRAGRPSPFQLLAKQLGGGSATAETLIGPDGAYGHMLLSRWPLDDAVLHDLSVPGQEPRSAIAAQLRTPRGKLQVIATHLGLKRRERHVQALKLARLVRKTAGPVVLMGDLNDWTWRGPVWKALSPVLPSRTSHRTFPSRFPLLRLDEIFCRPTSLLGPSWRDLEAKEASDHLPVIAELNMAASSGRNAEDAAAPAAMAGAG